MPAIYAHERFGRMVSEQIQGELKDIIEKYNTQFRIGLQGPDIFFFYRAWSGNAVRRYGSHLHEISARRFFEHAVKTVQKTGRDTPEYAYLMGFVCHFILDSECHPVVDMMIEETGVQHLEIEAEFEKMLLRKDGEDACAYPIWKLVPTDCETAKAIVPFYARKVNAKLVRNCLKYMRFIKRLFTAPQKWKQKLINGIMRRMGTYEEMNGLMNQLTDNPLCEESNAVLYHMFQESVELAVSMIGFLDESICNQKELHTRFDRNFE